MAYTYGEYTLHKKMQELKDGKEYPIYFFAKRVPKAGEPCNMPKGYKLGGTNSRTGLPYLKKE